MNAGKDRHAEDFDLLSTPLEGTTLIEAGAGTGKTYTLTAIVLRLIAEHGLPIDRILVVTFTEAATAELKERIRAAIRTACREIEGIPSGDPFLTGLAARLPEPETALARLREAIASFDLAAVCTIHGFCNRLLRDNAFESGSPFETELEGDQSDVLRGVVDDFWRGRIYRESLLFISYLMDRSFTPETIVSMLQKTPRGPFTRLTPLVEIPDTSPAERMFLSSFTRLQQTWRESGTEAAALIEQSASLKRNVYRTASMPGLIREMESYMELEDPGFSMFPGFDKFTTSKLRASCKKGAPDPVHPLFDLCEIHLENHRRLQEIFTEKLVGLKSLAFSFTEAALGRRKAETGRVSFDDLLRDVHDALDGPGGARFARAVGESFGAVLIDEFQDTDAIQWSIFKRIFQGRDVKIFLIGDPKQAIYGFRGADIFAYMRAAEEAENRYTLRTNRRSEPGLVSAVNTLFARGARPFLFKDIPYLPSASASANPVQAKPSGPPPFNLWLLGPEDGRTAEPKADARTRIAGAVAGEIARLLEAGRIGDAPVSERHIAVLVRTNNEAALMQKTFGALGIPSVRHQTGNVFETGEALEVRRLLTAIAVPGNFGLLRAALSTDLLGRRGEDLALPDRDSGGWDQVVENFHDYHRLWHEQGFIHMMRRLLAEHRIVPRLTAMPDGERRATNLLHLSELLRQASTSLHIPETLMKWLADRIEGGSGQQDEHLLRLESDRDAVTLVTIHKSKGLEYPVVFCPFCWSGSDVGKGDPALNFHDPAGDFELVVDIGENPPPEHLALARQEILAENLRLLYVALTRAKTACYLVWGTIKGTETSAPAWLFHRPDPPPEGDRVKALADRCRSLSPEVLEEEVLAAVAAAAGNIAVSPLPDGRSATARIRENEAEELACRTFTGSIGGEWRIASFSSIVFGARSAPEAPDHDEAEPGDAGMDAPEPAAGPVPFADMFSFPRGTGAGSFLHDLLEHTDFTAVDDPKTSELVHAKCSGYGFDPRWVGALMDMLQNTVLTPLDPGLPGLTLSRVPGRDRVNELEFLFPLARITPDVLAGVFRGQAGGVFENPAEAIERLPFSAARGFMKGFMDMVFRWDGRFYLVDWKSNFLGEDIEDYRRDSLARAMEDGYYILQYHIYTLALDRYLQHRMPEYRYEDHFGGVFYVFLRGMSRERGPDYGIFRDKPSEETIAALRSRLLDRPPEG